jgi:hypothetical protein
MPKVGMLCFGTTAAGQIKAVVSTNVTQWHSFGWLEDFYHDARRNFLPAPYIDANPVGPPNGSIVYLSNRLNQLFLNVPLAPGVVGVPTAWNNAIAAVGVPPTDAGRRAAGDPALATAWGRICTPVPPMGAAAPPIPGNPRFTRPLVVAALSFTCRNGQVRERCKRCRILFQFNMDPREPANFNEPPPPRRIYPDKISCAEVTAYHKCGLWGL